MRTAEEHQTNADTKANGRPGSERRDATDLLGLDNLFSDEELAVREEVRSFVDEKIKPNLREWWEGAIFPRELVPEMAARGLLGMHLKEYGCAGKSAVSYGLACLELEAGDSGLRTFVSVQGSLAMSAIYKFGSEEQKEEWLPKMAKGEAIGCFGLTEPEAGSDPASMKTFARKDGSGWVIDGEKRWIGMGTIADVAVIWAQTDDGIRGFLVPTDAQGFSARDIQQKLSMRASVQCDLFLNEVDRKSTRLNSSHANISYAVFCLKKKNTTIFCFKNTTN